VSDAPVSRFGASKRPDVDADLHSYVVEHGTPPDPVLTGLIAATREQFGESAGMQVDAVQGAFLTMLTRLVAPTLVVEVGTFTGYSSICIARGLPEGGRVLCCDVSEEFTSLARRTWAEAGLDDRIELRLGPAAETLAALPDDTVVDMAFIDADKSGYLTYYEAILERMPSGGLVVVDNVMWHGQVVDDSDDSVDTVAIRAFNDHVAADDRVEASMIPVGDGLTLARKR
jgi:caffeoyl-CoA O-methyltransferase